MSDNHITEPLDYLYEELPPERMAEARKHLAVCPDCRERVRDIRETVKLYRQLPRPTPPAGLAARAASAALAAAKQPQPEPVVLATPASARARIPANGAAGASERRQTKLEEDFERLKQEVKDEMRRGWRQWFFHPAWTIVASALLLASLAIHYSPRERYEQPIRPRESALVADSARVLRNRERIPAPEPLLAGAAVEAADAPDRPVTSTPLPPAPAALREANARRDLPLPSLAKMQLRARPAVQPERLGITGTAEIALAGVAPESEPAESAEAPKRVEAKEPATIAAAAAPLPPPAAAPEKLAAARPSAAASVPDESAEVAVAAAQAAAADPVVLDELAEEAMEVAAAPAAETGIEPAVAAVSAPAQSGETTPVLTPDELAALAAAPVDAGEDSATIVAMAEMDAPQLIERPEGFDVAERIRTLSALAGMQIASGEIADAWKTVGMLRRYSPAAAEEISALVTEAEKAALAEKEPPPPAVEPAPTVEPVPAAEPAPPFPGAMIEPPENPPLSMVIVPAYMQPATTGGISEDIPLRETLAPSRSAELARTLRQSLDPVIPLQVYIRPVAPAPVFVPAPVSAPAPVISPTPEPEPEPAPVPAPAPKKSKRKRSGNTPYLRDY